MIVSFEEQIRKKAFCAHLKGVNRLPTDVVKLKDVLALARKLDNIAELLKNRPHYHVYDSDGKTTISFAYRGLLDFIEKMERELKK